MSIRVTLINLKVIDLIQLLCTGDRPSHRGSIPSLDCYTNSLQEKAGRSWLPSWINYSGTNLFDKLETGLTQWAHSLCGNGCMKLTGSDSELFSSPLPALQICQPPQKLLEHGCLLRCPSKCSPRQRCGPPPKAVRWGRQAFCRHRERVLEAPLWRASTDILIPIFLLLPWQQRQRWV